MPNFYIRDPKKIVELSLVSCTRLLNPEAIPQLTSASHFTFPTCCFFTKYELILENPLGKLK